MAPEINAVRVDWESARVANLANWNDRVAIHRGSPGYGIERLIADPGAVSSVIRDDLPVLNQFLPGGTLVGLSLVHLQCHIGTDTLSLARSGAGVVGVDFSPEAIAAATQLASQMGIDAAWVLTDVLDARAAVTRELGPRTFDVVYTSIGTIGWLQDLDLWAAQVAALLAPGGVFYIRDGHPMLYTLHDDDEAPLVRFPYFANGEALEVEDHESYAGDGTVAHPTTYEFPHSLAEVFGALIGQGLSIVHFDEGQSLPWQFAERMEDLGDGNFAFPANERDLIPCTFTIVATAPGH